MVRPGDAGGGGGGRDGFLLHLAVHNGLVTPAQAAAARERAIRPGSPQAGDEAATLMELRRSGVLSAADVEGLERVAEGLARRGSGEAADFRAEASGPRPAAVPAASSDLKPDAPRLGPYLLLGELGRGGMGAVYIVGGGNPLPPCFPLPTSQRAPAAR